MRDQQVGTEDVVAKVVSSSIHYINYIEQKEITLLLSLGLASLCVTKRRRRSKALVALAIVFCASDDLWLEGEGLQAGTFHRPGAGLFPVAGAPWAPPVPPRAIVLLRADDSDLQAGLARQHFRQPADIDIEQLWHTAVAQHGHADRIGSYGRLAQHCSIRHQQQQAAVHLGSAGQAARYDS